MAIVKFVAKDREAVLMRRKVWRMWRAFISGTYEQINFTRLHLATTWSMRQQEWSNNRSCLEHTIVWLRHGWRLIYCDNRMGHQIPKVAPWRTSWESARPLPCEIQCMTKGWGVWACYEESVKAECTWHAVKMRPAYTDPFSWLCYDFFWRWWGLSALLPYLVT